MKLPSFIRNSKSIFALTFITLLAQQSSAHTQDYLLNTGVPTSNNGPLVLTTAQFLAGEFSATAGEDVGQVGAYLTQGVGEPGATFVFDIYSGLPDNTFLSRSSQREAPLATVTGTFTTNGWTLANIDWTAPTTGDYWLALQVPNVAGHTPGLDAPLETSASTGSAPALAFAFTGTSGQYTESGAQPIGLEVIEAPEPSSFALLAMGFGLIGLAVRARWRQV